MSISFKYYDLASSKKVNRRLIFLLYVVRVNLHVHHDLRNKLKILLLILLLGRWTDWQSILTLKC